MRIVPLSGEAPGAAGALDDVIPAALFLPSLEHALRVAGIEVGCQPVAVCFTAPCGNGLLDVPSCPPSLQELRPQCYTHLPV